MSNSRKSQIRVFTEDFGVVDLKILDGRFHVVAQGRGYLWKELPAGIYKVEASAGVQTWSQLVALEEGDTEEVRVPPLVLRSSAPLYASRFAHEYHERAAAAESHKEHVIRGTGSAIFIMVRYYSPDPQKPDLPSDHPMTGLSLHDQNGNQIVDLVAESAYHAPDPNESDPWAACNVAVAPGYFRLRQELYPGKTIEMPLVAAHEWQIQLFALLEPVENAPSFQLRANLTTSSIFYSHYSPGNPHNSQAYQLGDQHMQRIERLTEIARQSLTGRRLAESQELSEMFTEKFENPMLGILGGHLVLRQKEPNLNTLSFVVSNLRRMLGNNHPDVNALALASRRSSPSTYIFDNPPMLRESWQLVMRSSIGQPEIVSPESLAGTVAPRLWGEGIWLFWNTLDSGIMLDSSTEENERERDLGDINLSSSEAALVQQLAGLRGDENMSFGPEPNSLPQMNEDMAKRLVYTLGVPRGNVEAMLKKLSEQGQLYETTRSQMKPGRQRTIEMENVIAEIRAMSVGKQEEVAKALPRLIEEDTAGSRISALGVLQVRPDPNYLPFLLSAISHSKSAFEQFHALYASYKFLPHLDQAQRAQLKKVIQSQRGILPDQNITPGSDRWKLSNEILKRL
jgi:hypothetical protein